ncbi:hypothetical protein AVEN_53908-1 [Araneus ventricosus]|uniref:Uncharacterized protein n=1 Tax=Araneus ventricosus TaxID=182803 RepID=A0A4Y2IEF5_ARAVE|nr:hypothetical protein AVEN_53908-1 [Araneus ventricosus]
MKNEKEDKRKQRHKKAEFSKTKCNKPSKNPVKKKKLAKRRLDFQSSEFEDSTHSFQVSHVDTDDVLDLEDLDNEACIIFGELGKTEWWFQYFM